MDARKLRDLYRRISPDYDRDDIGSEWTTERANRVAWIIRHRLRPKDRQLFCLYADRASFREVAREVKCSHDTVRRNIIRIRTLILAELDRMERNNETI